MPRRNSQQRQPQQTERRNLRDTTIRRQRSFEEALQDKDKQAQAEIQLKRMRVAICIVPLKDDVLTAIYNKNKHQHQHDTKINSKVSQTVSSNTLCESGEFVIDEQLSNEESKTQLVCGISSCSFEHGHQREPELKEEEKQLLNAADRIGELNPDQLMEGDYLELSDSSDEVLDPPLPNDPILLAVTSPKPESPSEVTESDVTSTSNIENQPQVA